MPSRASSIGAEVHNYPALRFAGSLLQVAMGSFVRAKVKESALASLGPRARAAVDWVVPRVATAPTRAGAMSANPPGRLRW